MNRTLHAPLSQLVLYGLGNVAGQAVNLLLLPVISHRLTPAAYGTFSMALVLFMLLGMTLDLGVLQGLVKLYSEAPSRAAGRSVFTASLVSVSATATLLCVPVVLLARPAAALIFGSPAFAPHVVVVTAGAWASVLFQLVLAYHRSAQSPVRHGIISLVRALMFGAFTLVLLARLDNGLTALLAGWLLPYGIAAACLLPFLALRNRSRFGAGTVRHLFAYGLPLVPSVLVMWLLTHTDVWLLRRLASMAHVGQYTLAMQLCYLLAPAATALQMGWLPFVLRTAARTPTEAPARIARLWTIVFALTGTAALALGAFAPELVRLVAAETYAPAARAVPLLALSTLLYICFLSFSAGIHVSGRTWILSLITAGAAVLNIGINLAVIPRWGISGAAAATVASNAVMAAAAALASHRLYPVPYRNRLSVSAAAVLSAAALACAAVPGGSAGGTVAKAVFTAAAVGILVKSGVLGRNLLAHAAATVREMGS